CQHALGEPESGLGENVEPGEFLGGKGHVDRAYVLVELRDTAGPNDDRRHGRLRKDPCQGHAGDGGLVCFGDDLEFVDNGVRLLVEELLDEDAAIGLVPTIIATCVLAAERAALER